MRGPALIRTFTVRSTGATPEEPFMHRHARPAAPWFGRRRAVTNLLVPLTLLAAACGTGGAAATDEGHAQAPSSNHQDGTHEMDPQVRATAQIGTARYQDVAIAERDGYTSSRDTLGCFEQAGKGGMGLHFIDEALLDDHLDVAAPEALVYELGADGEVVGLVAHEYIVPVDAWTSDSPPQLFGMDLHRHPTLPLWVLHTWLWKDNPTGLFADWNPAVRPCPEGVPVFGRDLPVEQAD